MFYNIDLAQQTNAPRLFKKLKKDIWGFRTLYAGLQIRLLAFWDKTDGQETLVFCNTWLCKKVDKVSGNEIDKAIQIREKYFSNKPEK